MPPALMAKAKRSPGLTGALEPVRATLRWKAVAAAVSASVAPFGPDPADVDGEGLTGSVPGASTRSSAARALAPGYTCL
jgi:hypothetical protein